MLTFLGFTTFGFLNFEYRYLNNLARGVHGTFEIGMFEEMTGSLRWPVAVSICCPGDTPHSHPPRKLVGHAARQFAGYVCFSVADTAGMSSKMLAPLFRLGRYDYGTCYALPCRPDIRRKFLLKRSLLYQAPMMDPLAISGSILLLLAVSATAAMIPAYRAAAVDPIRALSNRPMLRTT